MVIHTDYYCVQNLGINRTAQLESLCFTRQTAFSCAFCPSVLTGSVSSMRSVTRCHTDSKPSRLKFSSIAFTRNIICPCLHLSD